jgi:hypothetical protein
MAMNLGDWADEDDSGEMMAGGEMALTRPCPRCGSRMGQLVTTDVGPTRLTCLECEMPLEPEWYLHGDRKLR